MVNSIYGSVRRELERNWYVDDLCRRIVGIKYNTEMLSFINSVSKIDSVKHIEDFCNALDGLPSTIGETSYTLKRAFSENSLYGYSAQILKYAGLKDNDVFYLPILEHGISFDLTFPFISISATSALLPISLIFLDFSNALYIAESNTQSGA